jgi:putative (di)nucleoside polyphosphate hydrolase
MDFRPNVAAIIINDENKILVGQRSDIPGSWQLPQGGIDGGENAEEAVIREIKEETGIMSHKIEIIRKSDEICYTFPDGIDKKMGFKGQRQIFFLIKLTDPDCKPEASDEFSSFEWVTKDVVLNRIVGFKKNSYMKAFRQIFGD